MINRQKSVKALLPLKAHSERVPSKNVRDLCGKPLFHWILISLSNSPYVDEIIIDTDSIEIAKDAKNNFDVTILMRPERLWGDMVGIIPLIEFELSNTLGEIFIQTHSTNPLLTTATIDKAITAYFDSDVHDSVFSVTPLQTRLYNLNGGAINHDPDNMLRTQDLPPVYEENSNFYIFSRETFESCNHRIGKNPLMYEMDPKESIDIDEELDFQLASFFMQERLDIKA